MDFDLFAASRLTMARQRRGFTKTGLAGDVQVSNAAMTEFENASRSPSPDTAIRIATALNMPIEFFYGDEVDSVHPGLSSFRALRSMTARVRDRVLATGTLAATVVSPYLHRRFVLPEVQLPEATTELLQPELTAVDVRHEWSLGEAPIDNLVHLLEARGISVYWVDEQSLSMDAFSFWRDDRPYIVLNGQRPGERQRLSIAHELGHLVLHRDVATNDREVETEAFAFASSLLLPEGQFRESFRQTTSFSELFAMLFRLKREWGTSVAATLRRSRDLNLVSERQYNRACRELSIQGWRKAEPRPIKAEQSLLHEKVFQRLHAQGITPAQVAHELHISVSDILELMPVSRQYHDDDHQVSGEREHLRLLT